MGKQSIFGFIFCLLAGLAVGDLLKWRNLNPSFVHARAPKPGSKPQNGGSDCGETITNLKDGDHGMIESPGYPKDYDGGLDCEWKIEGEPGTVIQATVFELRTENSFLSDASDSLFVTLSGNWSDSQRFSGDLNKITPLVLLTEANSFGVRFRTSRFTEGNRGFKISYHTRATNTGQPAVTEPGNDIYVVVLCNYLPVDPPQAFLEEGISLKESPSQAQANGNGSNPNPFLVALVLDDQQFCSGTLLSNRHVITSAHCTRGVQKIGMVFGADNILEPGDHVQRREAQASSVTEHPHFDPYTGANDLSVIELDQPVEITKFVVPASIPSWSYIGTTFGGYRGEVTGWGDSKTGTVYSTANSKPVTISPNAACINNSGHNGLSMCSWGQPSTTCQADSGSPIITRAGYCGGPTNQVSGGNGGINNQAQKPPRPSKPANNNSKPSKPANNNSKPSKPANNNSKPSKPGRPHLKDSEPKYQANVLLGIVSYGSCDQGFSFTRITAYLDFLTRTVAPISLN